MLMINTHEAKTRLSSLLAQVERGEDVVYICRGGKPVARLMPLEKPKGDPLTANPSLKPIRINGDLCGPLDDKDWPEVWR